MRRRRGWVEMSTLCAIVATISVLSAPAGSVDRQVRHQPTLVVDRISDHHDADPPADPHAHQDHADHDHDVTRHEHRIDAAEAGIDRSNADDAERLIDQLLGLRAEQAIGSPTVVELSSFRICFGPQTPDEVQADTINAVSTWQRALDLTGPVIEIEVFWIPFGSPTTLGAAGPSAFVIDEQLPLPYEYPAALAGQLLGADVTPGDNCSSSRTSDIVVLLNSAAGGEQAIWHTGAGRPAPGEIDLETVMLHELAHGLGMVTDAGLIDDELRWPSSPGPGLVYDALTARCGAVFAGNCIAAEPLEVGDVSALTDEAWIAMGETSTTRLHTPPVWNPGSSFVHFDEERHGSDAPLMTPAIDPGEIHRLIDDHTLDVMARMGYPLATPVDLPQPASRRAQLEPFASIDEAFALLTAIDPTAGADPVALTARIDDMGIATVVADRIEATEADRLIDRQIARLYVGVLGRLPDINGWHYWREQVDLGASVADVALLITDSEEYRRAETDPSRSFVDAVYERVFGRPTDADAQAFWLEQLESGLHPGHFTLALTESGEHRAAVDSQVGEALVRRLLDGQPASFVDAVLAELSARESSASFGS